MVVKPWLWISPNLAHALMHYSLGPASILLGKGTQQWKSLRWEGLSFPNPLGIAGGVDKNADHIEHWTRLGAGFIEVGTITLKSQGPNPGKILDRDKSKTALWNKMGFPNAGVEHALKRLKNLNRSVPVFANIGKNRNTENANAPAEYSQLISHLDDYVDAFVINISSPNTQGLRELLKPENLTVFLKSIQARKKPLLLKLSPDMSDTETLFAADTALAVGFKGLVLTNTRLNSNEFFPSHEGGGVSGTPLKSLSEQKLKLVSKHVKDKKMPMLIVSVGGVLSAADVKHRLELGADLVQVYSSLIFTGPNFFNLVAEEAIGWH